VDAPDNSRIEAGTGSSASEDAGFEDENPDDQDMRMSDRSYEADKQEELIGSVPGARVHSLGEHPAGAVLTDRDMVILRSLVKDRVTDTDKEALLKKELEDRGLRTAQVRDMLGWLSFETTRLDFAKWAYNQVIDRDIYRHLEDVFSFDGSKEEFRKLARR
jgi:hypothetical protein